MDNYTLEIKKFGDRAVLLEWPEEISEQILLDILRFRDHLRTVLQEGWEICGIYHSLTVVAREPIEDFEGFKLQLLQAYKEAGSVEPPERHLWEVPVCYEDEELAPDLEQVAQRLNMSTGKLIKTHTAHEYTVYGIGFLPGFLYLGGLPSTLEIPRREHPRQRVERGSVGLAGKQTGIYPRESPGGWHIIGNCPVPVFRVGEDPPVRLQLADRIKFFPVSRGEYDLHKLEAEVGIYEPRKTRIDA